MSANAPRMPRVPRSWRTEVLLFVGAYAAYSLARGATPASFETALDNARLVVDVQARLGIGIERVLQEHLIGLPLMWVLNRLYLIAQFAVLPAALVWVYRRRPDLYPRLRTTVIATWLIALPVYALFPTAPPRLAGIGILDTVSVQTSFALDSPLVTAFYNPVAAVPSLHAGFAFAIGIGVASATSRRWAKFAAVAWGPAIALVVIATGNHFVLDVVLGMVAVLLGYAVALLLHRSPPNRAAAEGPESRCEAPLARRDGGTLRLALVCPYDWEVPGGVRTHVAGLAGALRERGHSVDILTAGRTCSSRLGVTLLGATRPIRANGSVARVALGIGTVRRVGRALRKGGYDVVHLHEPLVPTLCLTALCSRRSALVGTFHMCNPRSIPYRLLRPVLRLSLRRLSVRIAVSESARACAAPVTSGEVVVIPNGVAPAEPRGARSRLGTPSAKEPRIVFIGRHEPRKGLDVLLRAFAELPRTTHLDLVGVDPDEIRGMDLTADTMTRVHPRGRVSDEERHQLLLGADVLGAPSLGGESFGLVLVEAMALGIPVVASAIPGYRDVLPTRCGRLVPPGDHEALAHALAEVLGDPGLRVRLAHGAASAVAPFAWPGVAARVEERYREAIASSRHPGAARTIRQIEARR